MARAHADARMGWVTAPSPVHDSPESARALGLDWLGFKRDDLIEGLVGGTKVRKLDGLLSTPPFCDAPAWASMGAIGSGHLVTLSAAARELGRSLYAHVFWEPATPGIVDSLAYVASGPGGVRYTHSRVGLALSRPGLLLASRHRGHPVVPAGATAPAGIAGVVRGAMELAEQGDEVPPLDRVYVALGSGGTVAGLLLGLGLAGLRPRICAVAAVERVFVSERRIRRLVEATAAWMGVEVPPLPRLAIDHGQLGRGYGISTPASREACERFEMLEPLYSGKAMAALLADPGEGRVLVWVTPRRREALPHAEDWVERLPRALRRRLAGRGPTRRWVVAAGGAALLGARVLGYAEGRGETLADFEVALLRAASEALFPDVPAAVHAAVPARIDAYLRTFPPSLVRQLHAALALIEHGTLLGGEWRRFTRLEVDARARLLDTLARRGGVQAELYRAVRDCCALAVYQHPATWAALGYGGPLLPSTPRTDAYGALRR